MTDIKIIDTSIPAGTRTRIEIPVARLATDAWFSIPVEVVHGQHPGPRVWISAAVHGDELNGIEIIRSVLEKVEPAHLHGAVIAVPIVNVFGFLYQDRYLPDRRDLNRSFPGSKSGSLASRLAHLFMAEIVKGCTHGIDLHTGSNHRTNLPQVRANLKDAETRRCAEAFHAPMMMHSQTRDGSLREAATRQGIHALLYEAGEPLRFDQDSIHVGVDGVLRVLHALEMIEHSPSHPEIKTMEVSKSSWIRARASGIFRLGVKLGEQVEKKQIVGVIGDAFGDLRSTIRTPKAGVIIGHTTNPLVNRGDALVHLGDLI